MSILITPEEIEQFRTSLADYPAGLAALDMLEDCEGDLEDAAISLAIQVGQEPDTSDRWIDGLAKRWRAVICQPDLKQSLAQGLTPEFLTALTESRPLSPKLATLVGIYVLKTGVQNFCQVFEASFGPELR